MTRMLSLAAGTVLDVDPATAVGVAAAAGFDAAGIWFDPATWTDRVAATVASRLADTGLVALDIEPIILGRGADHGERVLAAAAAIGARHVLVAGGPATHGEVVARLAELCEVAAQVAPATVLVLEFLPIFAIGTLAGACAVADEVGAANLGVLVDTLHLARSGGTPADLTGVRGSLLPYLQIADAPGEVPATAAGLRDEALHGRLLPGNGVLPIDEVVAAVPGVPLSAELRSAALVARHPEPLDRARAVRRSLDRWRDA